MLEWFSANLAYTVAKDIWARLRPSRRSLTPSQIVEVRQRWKPQFEHQVQHTHRNRLRQEVIIRDMKRMDVYPDHHEGRGISPWFRVFLVGTYHRGILVAHSGLGTLTKQGSKWRYTNYEAGEQGDLKVLMISSIPFESIDNVDWHGDENYDYPHIYCFFEHRKQPYEKTAFYTETKPRNGNVPFFNASYDEVKKRSRKLGIKHFG